MSILYGLVSEMNFAAVPKPYGGRQFYLCAERSEGRYFTTFKCFSSNRKPGPWRDRHFCWPSAPGKKVAVLVLRRMSQKRVVRPVRPAVTQSVSVIAQSILKFWANVQGLRCSGRVLNMYGNEVILTGTRYSKRTGLDTAIVSLVGGTLKNWSCLPQTKNII